jgi:uncharacterized membrane protein HdeD (DUF308 family)
MLTGVSVEQMPRSGWDVFVMWGLVGLILLGATLTLRPFMPAILWGTVLAISLAPVQQAIMGYVGGRRRFLRQAAGFSPLLYPAAFA